MRHQAKKPHWNRLSNDLSGKSHIYSEQHHLEAFRELTIFLVWFQIMVTFPFNPPAKAVIVRTTEHVTSSMCSPGAGGWVTEEGWVFLGDTQCRARCDNKGLGLAAGSGQRLCGGGSIAVISEAFILWHCSECIWVSSFLRMDRGWVFLLTDTK